MRQVTSRETTTAHWAPPDYRCVLTTIREVIEETPEGTDLQIDVTVVDADAETVHNKGIIQEIPMPREVPAHEADVVEHVDHSRGTRRRYPIVTRGRDFTAVEFTALQIKLDVGVQPAASFLRGCGWDVEHARELLCVVGRRVH
jgi:hypothetical protein